MSELLGNLEPAPKIGATPNFRAGIEFDGTEGTATTEGLPSQPNFDDFLRERGYSPEEYEVVGNTVRTSQWQTYQGDWLTSFRFTFRRKAISIDLPALMAEARRAKPVQSKPTGDEKALVVCPADFQIGKTGSRGGTKDLIARVMRSFTRIEAMAKQGRYERIYVLDLGDLIESVSSKASMNQLDGNDLSVPQQVDAGAALLFDLIKRLHKFAPITYGSIASNHCQNRVNGQQVGKPGLDDWGIVVAQQLKRLTSELGWDVTYLVPQPYDEGFAFQYGVNTVGVVHGHQASRPDAMEAWWQKQTFSNQWSAACNLLLHGHWHHTSVRELGNHVTGGSRFIVMGPSSDSGSDWWRNAGGGGDASTGILTLELDKHALFRGTVRVY
jgi:hypothetical protein